MDIEGSCDAIPRESAFVICASYVMTILDNHGNLGRVTVCIEPRGQEIRG